MEPALSVTCAVKANEPVCPGKADGIGVPERVPELLSESPVGSVPPIICHE